MGSSLFLQATNWTGCQGWPGCMRADSATALLKEAQRDVTPTGSGQHDVLNLFQCHRVTVKNILHFVQTFFSLLRNFPKKKAFAMPMVNQ